MGHKTELALIDTGSTVEIDVQESSTIHMMNRVINVILTKWKSIKGF